VADVFKTKQIEGLSETIKLLQKFDKDGLKIMNKEIYQVVKKIQLEARAMMPTAAPLTKWGENPPENYKPTQGSWNQNRLQYNVKAARMGIRPKIESQKVSGYRTERAYNIINENAAAMIYEWAGRSGKDTSAQGKHFINSMGNPPSKGRGRVIWKAVYDNKAYAKTEITNAMNRAIAALNRKLAS
jgi:hypothetical protein